MKYKVMYIMYNITLDQYIDKYIINIWQLPKKILGVSSYFYPKIEINTCQYHDITNLVIGDQNVRQ